jgi:hypothetical protein
VLGLLLGAAASVGLAAVGIIVALILSVSGASALIWAYFKAGSGKAIIAQQDAAIHALEVTIQEYDRWKVQIMADHARMAEKLQLLEEMVTQAAKVDQLITIVREGFEKLGCVLTEPTEGAK